MSTRHVIRRKTNSVTIWRPLQYSEGLLPDQPVKFIDDNGVQHYAKATGESISYTGGDRFWRLRLDEPLDRTNIHRAIGFQAILIRSTVMTDINGN